MTRADLFACPRCDRAPLTASEHALRCDGCKVDFPFVGGLPWLFAEPLAAYGEWRGRLHYLLRDLEHEENTLRQALDGSKQSAARQSRITRHADAIGDHRQRLAGLLAPLDLDELTADRTTYLALRTKLPADHGLTTYYGNVHRDWFWGNAENDASLAIVLERLGERPAGRTLVLGCGAGRLAHDLQRATGTTPVVAADFNPLLLFVADRMARGETLEMYEFPVAPIDSAHIAMLNTLSGPGPAEVTYCVADVHRPPFAKASFDTIVTPWLVDVLPEPFDRQVRRINHLLADGGAWINFGSLSFHDASSADRLSADECLASIAASGFDEPVLHDTEIPYMTNPVSRHRRAEVVASWIARKTGKARRDERYEALPDWIVRGRDPVPLADEFRQQAVATRIHAWILGLIDGKRSIEDMAVAMEQQRLMTRDEARASIRQFMITLYETTRRGVRY